MLQKNDLEHNFTRKELKNVKKTMQVSFEEQTIFKILQNHFCL